MAAGAVLSRRELQGLRAHTYSAASASLIEPYLQPLWNWVVSLVPLWVAPNLITIVGLAINISTTLLLVWYCPTATERAPWWATASAALGLWLYQLLDAIDGKQARRTGSAGPLGELFDHGCDSASTVFVSLASCCSVRLGLLPGWLLLQNLIASTLFYSAHWRTYTTGTLQFGRIDVTEGQYVVMAVMLVSSAEDALGTDIWTTQVPGLPLTWQAVYLAAGLAIAFNHMRCTLPSCVRSPDGSGTSIAGTHVLSPLGPLLLVLLPTVGLAVLAPDLHSAQPLLSCFLFGVICSKLTNRLIVAHMCRGPVPQWDPLMLAPLLVAGARWAAVPLTDRLLLLLALAWATGDLLYYCSSVCRDICRDFKINTFTIPYKGEGNKSK